VSVPILSFESRTGIVFGDGHYDWIDVKAFGLRPPNAESHVLLQLLLAEPAYRDHYTSPPDDDQGDHSLHGPYRLDAIAPDSFVSVPLSEVADALRAFGRRYSSEQETEMRLGKVAAQVEPLLDGGTRAFRLGDLGDGAQHEFGWILDHFTEFVVVNDTSQQLFLIVAGQD
jgi:hypothetical protein